MLPVMRLGVGAGWIRRHRWPLLAGVVALVAAIVAVVVLTGPEPEPQPRARAYRDYDVCVLTGDRGLADPSAAAVWAGVQQVSALRDVRVLYVPVAGEQTAARATELLGSLVQQQCDIIVAVGDAPVAAVAVNKTRYPNTTILAVGHEIDASSDAKATASTVEALLNLVPEK